MVFHLFVKLFSFREGCSFLPILFLLCRRCFADSWLKQKKSTNHSVELHPLARQFCSFLLIWKRVKFFSWNHGIASSSSSPSSSFVLFLFVPFSEPFFPWKRHVRCSNSISRFESYSTGQKYAPSILICDCHPLNWMHGCWKFWFDRGERVVSFLGSLFDLCTSSFVPHSYHHFFSCYAH